MDSNPAPVTFSWALDGAAVLSQDLYIINGTRSIATISPRSPQDYGLLMCWASNTMGRQREPCTFRIVPAGKFMFTLFIYLRINIIFKNNFYCCRKYFIENILQECN